MQIIHTIAELRTVLNKQDSVSFVPTMGNLHAGHIQLVEIAKQHAKCVVVSIFVNPLQFGVNEDFASYPRTLEADCEKLARAGATVVFAPNVAEMYPQCKVNANGILELNQIMTIALPPIANELCGASRPGHFSGVVTVVLKLFNMVMPQVAVFGQKDFQQLFLVQELVKQFNLPIHIVSAETVREESGLAMSSRNGYLTTTQRVTASQLNSALGQIVQAVKAGSKDFKHLEQHAQNWLNQEGWLTDYISIRARLNLAPASVTDRELVVLGAAKIGNTRLIDNLIFDI